MKKICLVGVLTGVLFLHSSLYAKPVANSLSVANSLLSRFMSPQFNVRYKAYSDIVQVRKQHIQTLSQALETSTDISYEGTKHLAARLLGELNASEAIGTLNKHLLFRHEPNWFSFRPIIPQEQYPCALALVQIGYPAIQAMVGKIQLPTSLSSGQKKLQQEERELAAWVIMQIMGRDEAAAKLEKLAGQRSSPYKERLEEAVDYIRSYKIVRVEPKSAQNLTVGR